MYANSVGSRKTLTVLKPEVIWGSFATWMMIESGMMLLLYPIRFKNSIHREQKPVNYWSVFSIYLSLQWGIPWIFWVINELFDSKGGTLHLMFLAGS